MTSTAAKIVQKGENVKEKITENYRKSVRKPEIQAQTSSSSHGRGHEFKSRTAHHPSLKLRMACREVCHP